MAAASQSDARFSATHWSIVLGAAQPGHPGAQQALEELCRRYWYPVYAFIRRQGRSPHDAEDLTQGFFADLLRRDWLAGVQPEKGKFRTFLLACLTNYLSKVRAAATGPTRAPGQPILSLDAQSAEARYTLEPLDSRDPATLFERRLALILIEDVLDQLQREYTDQGRASLFDALRPHLAGEAERGDYTQTSLRLNMTEGAVRVAVSRLRDNFRQRLRSEIARTVNDPAGVDEELRCLVELSR